ncbi:meiotic recombination protein REC114-like isoform X2 [Mercenaria mercenaria]|uniref:meiotic recombination protein REC114-like isoform X2 n=1 Tax=Mercenaria mercenaria TaxID=6596 RepID=UPI00234F06B4|nr:meiotic recombination protein REC114-like isoform X2 [Mercenaria mercenaria]
MECQVWHLERYARMTSQTTSLAVGQDGWEESLALTGADSWIKGVSKGDSLMAVMKAQNQSRRYRVKFSPTAHSSGEDSCRACVEGLVKYFPIKIPEVICSGTTSSGTHSQQVGASPSSTPGNDKTLVGDVTLGQLADTMRTKSTKLPDLYARLGDGTQYDLGTLIKLCLADASFPAFVGQVEQELEKIQSEST